VRRSTRRKSANRCHRNGVWLFRGDRNIAVVPFVIGEQTFINLARDDYHDLYAIEVNGLFLNLRPLCGQWLTNTIAAGKVDIPAPGMDASSDCFFTATSTQWETFLRSNANFRPARRPQPSRGPGC
jgi:hypothetical protein